MAATAAILKINFEVLLLKQKATTQNLPGTRVSDTGPSWPSCFLFLHKGHLLWYSSELPQQGNSSKIHYENMPIQICSKFHLQKTENV